MRVSERRTERRLDQPKTDWINLYCYDKREKEETERNEMGNERGFVRTDALCIDDRLLQAQPLCDRGLVLGGGEPLGATFSEDQANLNSQGFAPTPGLPE